MFRLLFLLVATFQLSNCYVVQVKQDEKVPDGAKTEPKVPPIESRIMDGSEKGRRFEVKQRAVEDDATGSKRNVNYSNQVVYAVNRAVEAVHKAIVKPSFRSGKTKSFVEKILDTIQDYVNSAEFRRSKTMKYIATVIDIIKESARGPEYRSGKHDPNMRTDMIHLKDGKPSFVFALKPDFFINFAEKLFSSQIVDRFMDDVTHLLRKPKKYNLRYN